jgi:hypothetical protein
LRQRRRDNAIPVETGIIPPDVAPVSAFAANGAITIFPARLHAYRPSHGLI